MLKTNLINNNVYMFKPIKRDYGHHEVKAGEELGRFNMGSSIVAIIETPKDFEFLVKGDDHIRYGQIIGQAK